MHQFLDDVQRTFPPAFIELYCFVIGTVIGSFLNVCIYRIPLQKSTLIDRSHCTSCNAPIRWYQNIPVLSYVFLLGKCASCKARISPIYPLVEILTGTFFLLLYYYYGFSIQFPIYAVLGCSAIVLIFIDLGHYLLPAKITFPNIVIGFAFSFLNPAINWLGSLLGIFVGGILPFLVMVVYKWIRKKEGLGHGDIAMLAMVGAYMGIKGVLLVLFFSSVGGAIIGLTLIIALKKGMDHLIPYGVFIGAATLAMIFWGRQIWTAYFLR